ncbi:FISUMP domain-containing protein [Bacteroidota bacterium]
MKKFNIIFTRFFIIISIFSLFIIHSCKPEESDNTAPSASFSIDPISGVGNTETNFVFDASECVDYQDDAEFLEVRWDWEDDGTWDTDFSTKKDITHKFSDPGEYTIRMEVKDTENKSSSTTKSITVYFGNTPPTALFIVNPEIGFIDTTFTFDASESYDIEDPSDSLLIRWDWNGDASFDTQYSYEKIAYHKFENIDEYNVRLEVKDTKGLIDQLSFTVEVTGYNNSPLEPSNPFPADAAINNSTKTIITWEAIDPEGDPLSYDVYFGTQNNPPLQISNLEETFYDTGFLDYGTQYYWKIVVKDNHGQSVEGPVWTFATEEVENEIFTFTDQRDGKTYKAVIIGGLRWMAENLNVGTMINSSSGGDLNDGTSTNNGNIEKYCYNNDPKNCEIYGGLYQWNETMVYQTDTITQGICPEGWRIPTSAEWEELTDNYIPESAGRDLRYGSSSGFQAKYSGKLWFSQREYQGINSETHFWSSTEDERTINNQGYITHAFEKSLYGGLTDMHFDVHSKTYGLSIRCVARDGD